MSNKVALIGAGAMGGAIGTRLAETGNSLTVFDLDKEKVAALTAKGANAAPSAAQAAAVSDYVILSLNSPNIVRAAVFGAGSGVEGARSGTLIARYALFEGKVRDGETEARAATESVLSRFFEGRVHHHVTLANEFVL